MSKACSKGEIWLVDLGRGCGFEQSGLKQCVIVQNDVGNVFSATTIVCPIMTSETCKYMFKQYKLSTHVDINNLLIPSTIICEQIRVVDKSRLKRAFTMIDKDKINEIEKALRITFGMKGVNEDDFIFK